MAAQSYVTTAAQYNEVDLWAFDRTKADNFDDRRVWYRTDSLANLDKDQEEFILEQLGMYSIFLIVPLIVRTARKITISGLHREKRLKIKEQLMRKAFVDHSISEELFLLFEPARDDAVSIFKYISPEHSAFNVEGLKNILRACKLSVEKECNITRVRRPAALQSQEAFTISRSTLQHSCSDEKTFLSFTELNNRERQLGGGNPPLVPDYGASSQHFSKIEGGGFREELLQKAYEQLRILRSGLSPLVWMFLGTFQPVR
jgi:hypothetical protein